MAGAETYRMFIALGVPEAVKEQLRKVQRELRMLLPQAVVRLTKQEQIHLTLKFLGNVEIRRVDELVASVRAACESLRPFMLNARSIGFFPNAQRPRVIWVGANSVQDELGKLQRAVALSSAIFAGAPCEESFAGHLTLGRIKQITRQEARALENGTASFTAREFGNWTVRSVEIFRSELTPEGSRHIGLAEIQLKNSENPITAP